MAYADRATPTAMSTPVTGKEAAPPSDSYEAQRVQQFVQQGAQYRLPDRHQFLQISDSPAPQGYLANPHVRIVEEAHQILSQSLDYVDENQWLNAPRHDGVAILVSDRELNNSSAIPNFKGRTFIPNCRPIEVLAAVHLFSYRLIWDIRLSTGRILQRYSQHSLSFYAVWRGIGPIYSPRDAVGVQDVRFWGPQGERQSMAVDSTTRIDVVWRSIADADSVPKQEGKERLQIGLGAYRIEWVPELFGCNVTFVGEADLRITIPSFLWKVFAKDLPLTVGRLRSAVQRFGIPSYVEDLDDCVVVQTTYYYSDTRITTHRHHVRKPGSYSVTIDRQRMYPFGISIPPVVGEGAHAVTLQELGDRIVVSVDERGVGQEYMITIEPRDKESEPQSQNGWW